MAQEFSILAKLKLNTKDIQNQLNALQNKTISIGADTKDFDLSISVANAVLNKFLDTAGAMVDQVYELDKSLTEFKKVSDLRGSGLEKYTEQLSEAAEITARTTSQMVDAATMFRKSGFTDKEAADLAVVATAFQNVADTEISASQAAASIVSQIQAFGRGAIEPIHIIDAYNEVANNFAVGTNDLSRALELSAAGMATYGNTFEETIGLVTAGTEVMVGRSAQVARGLNTISANIVANSSVLQKYGIQVKSANGDLKSTYDVLTELKPVWDSLTDVERQALGQTLAGKNQYRVLASIMSNFEHATEATTTALNSQGSAMEENAAYMESLEARTNAIKKDFQDLANHVINSQLVKSVLSLTHELLQLADTGLGRVLIQLTLLGGIGWGAGHLIHASRILQVFKSDLEGFGKLLITLTGQQELLAVATGASAEASEADAAAKAKEAAAAKEASIAIGQALIVLGVFVGTAAAIYGLIKLFDHLNVTFEEQKSKLEDINEQYEELISEGSELNQLKNKAEELTEVEKKRLSLLLAQELSLKRQAAEQAKLAYESYTQEHTEDRYISEDDRAYWQIVDLSAEQANRVETTFNDLVASYKKGKISADDFKSSVYEQIEVLKEDAEYLKTVQESGIELTEGQKAVISVYDTMTNSLVDVTEATVDFTDILEEQTSSLQSLTEQLDDLASHLSVVKSAFEDFNDDGELTYSTIADIINGFSELDENVLDGYVSQLTDANLTGEEFNSIMSDMTLALIQQRIETMGLTQDDQRLVEMMLEEAGVANVSEIANYLLADSDVAVSTQTQNATNSIQDFNNQPIDVSAKNQALQSMAETFAGLQMKIRDTHAQLNKFIGAEGKWTKKTVTTTDDSLVTSSMPSIEFNYSGGGNSSKSGGGGSRSTAEKEKTQLEILKEKLKAIEDSYSDILSLTDSQYQLLVNQKAPTEDIVAKAQEYLNYLHQENEDLRALLDTIEDNEENHALILDIQTKINKNSSTWFTWSKKINDIYSDIANNSAKIVDDLNDKWKKSVDEQADALKALQGQMVDYYDERIEDIDKQIDGLNNNNKALKEQITLEEKLDAISRARQSRIMVYKDGKWQYVEDIDAVSSAVKDFQDYIRERQLQEQIEGLEKEKSALEDIKNAWNNMTKEFDDAKDKWLISQKLMIDTTLEEWQRLIDGVENYTAQYASIMSGESPYSTGRTSSNAYTTTTSNGGTVTYSSEKAIDFIENKPVGSYMEGGDGSLWYKREDGSTVVKAQDGAVAVINAKYANGTLGASGGLSLVGEHGTELRVLNRGDGILPADITRNLMAWGQTTPMQYIGNKFGQAMNVTIQALNLPNVVDGQGFVDYVRNNMFGQVLSYVH